MTAKVSCAQRIRQGLAIRNMSQKDLCEKTGIPKSAMSQYCSGTFSPKQKRTMLIAQALDVSEAWLMGYDVPMERNPTAEEKAWVLETVQEIGLPHGGGTVTETKALLRRVADMYGEKAVVLLRLTSIMSDTGVEKVIEYTKSIFQEYMDESIPRAAESPQEDAGVPTAHKDG